MSASPPRGLTAEARRLWRDLVEQFVIDDAEGLRLLQVACEALVELRAAEAKVRADGMTYTDRNGVIRRHPLLGVVRDSRSAMLSALRQLRLEASPTLKKRVGHPHGGLGL